MPKLRTDILDGDHLFVFSMKQAAHGPGEARLFSIGPEGFGQPARLDDRHARGVYRGGRKNQN